MYITHVHVPLRNNPVVMERKHTDFIVDQEIKLRLRRRGDGSAWRRWVRREGMGPQVEEGSAGRGRVYREKESLQRGVGF